MESENIKCERCKKDILSIEEQFIAPSPYNSFGSNKRWHSSCYNEECEEYERKEM